MNAVENFLEVLCGRDTQVCIVNGILPPGMEWPTIGAHVSVMTRMMRASETSAEMAMITRLS